MAAGLNYPDQWLKAWLAMFEAEVEKAALSLGACLVGFADLASYVDEYGVAKPILERFPRAVSIAFRLSNPIIDGISKDWPTEAYAHHYRVVNAALDYIALRVSSLIQKLGYLAQPIPASQEVDEERRLGALSHKGVAALAGLGWIGKSGLLVTKRYGPRVRLVTVVTNAPLKTGSPIPNECGDCEECVKACPSKAIVGRLSNRPRREDLVDVYRCDERLRFFASNPKIGVRVCGVCVKVCPKGGV